MRSSWGGSPAVDANRTNPQLARAGKERPARTNCSGFPTPQDPSRSHPWTLANRRPCQLAPRLRRCSWARSAPGGLDHRRGRCTNPQLVRGKRKTSLFYTIPLPNCSAPCPIKPPGVAILGHAAPASLPVPPEAHRLRSITDLSERSLSMRFAIPIRCASRTSI
jgi:hypothetical protein